MSYISLSDKDLQEMMDRVGIGSLDELYACLPEDIKLKRPLDLPPAMSEPELLRRMEETAGRNSGDCRLRFLGAGTYAHFIPAVVDYLSARGEFISPYTPYQPEVSQGTLQIIFEFQTMICQLTGLDVANASLYDGASGTAEAVLMASRLKKRPKVLAARSLPPQYRQVITTYVHSLDLVVEEIGWDPSGRLDRKALEAALDDQTAAVVLGSPNFFGTIEHDPRIAEIAHGKGALCVYIVAEALSMGILEPPGKMGADIVTGEAQSFGLPLSFGGPSLGFMSCGKDFIRQFPGRIAGRTTDVEGRPGFVLTLSTREQHIRRERATSNICTNQAWCALRAAMFLETLGAEGLRTMALRNMENASYALGRLTALPGVKRKFSGPVFNEFVLELPRPWAEVSDRLEEKGILAGYGLGVDYPELAGCVLVNVTEVHRKEDIDRLVEVLGEVLGRGR